MANLQYSGFRWVKSLTGAVTPPQFTGRVASAYATQIRVGDPVKRVADGTFERAAAGDALIYGVVSAIVQYWDGSKIVLGGTDGGKELPASTTYGSNLDRASLIKVIPVPGQVFEVDCNDADAATTRSAYEAFINENCDHVFSSDDTALDIGTHVITAAQWHIVDIPDLNLQDFASSRVKVHVVCNESEHAAYSTTRTA